MNFPKIRQIVFFSLLVGMTILFAYTLSPFFYPLLWSAILATLFYPIYDRLLTSTKKPNLSAFITLVVAVLVIIIPLSLVSSLLVKESIDLYGSINDNGDQIQNSIRNTLEAIKNNSYAQKLHFNDTEWINRLSDIGRTVAVFFFSRIQQFTQNSLIFLGMFFLTIYSLFYFLRDGKKLLLKIMRLCPLDDDQEIHLYEKFTSTVRATIKGTILIGIVQGCLGGILFFITGVQGALIWTLVMIFASFVPGVGAALIYIPAGIIMLITGGIWQGILILVGGLVVISTIDNFLRPVLVGKGLQMHPVLILFSTLGGIIIFGASGFVVGPLICALAMSFWEIYEYYYKIYLNKNKP